MKQAWQRSKVPIFGVLGIVLVTLIVFASVRPDLLTVQQPKNSLTGNAVVDDLLFPKITPKNPCSDLDDPVCGADGKTYTNLCFAHKAGTDMKYRGPCKQDGWVKE